MDMTGLLHAKVAKIVLVVMQTWIACGTRRLAPVSPSATKATVRRAPPETEIPGSVYDSSEVTVAVGSTRTDVAAEDTTSNKTSEKANTREFSGISGVRWGGEVERKAMDRKNGQRMYRDETNVDW
jgi:hypothetical protein